MKNLILYIKAFLDRYIYLLPIFMLLCTLVSNFVELNYVRAGNTEGYSLCSNTIAWYLFNCTNKKYCWLTRNIPIGLFVLNLVDIIGTWIDYAVYVKLFNVFVCAIILILAMIFGLKKLVEND